MDNSLPKIVRFLGTSDCEGSSCPHCGATGRYVHHFQVEGGQVLGAMSGCVKLFPVSRIANEELRLREKLEKYLANGWKGLNRIDSEALAAIERFYSGVTTEDEALRLVDLAKRANQMNFKRR